MTPEAHLADLVDSLLSRGGKLDPMIGTVAIGIAQIADAIMEAQSKSGNWGGMLSKLRSGADHIRIGVEQLREESGFEALIAFAERQSALAAATSDAIRRLQTDESTLI